MQNFKGHLFLILIVCTVGVVALLGLSHSAEAGTLTVNVGSSQLLMTPSQRAATFGNIYAPDGTLGATQMGTTNFFCAPDGLNLNSLCWTWSNINSTTTISKITIATNIARGASGSFDQNYAGGGALYFDAKSNLLLQLYHGEYWYSPTSGTPFYAGLGLAYSADHGTTWHKLGQVIAPQTARANNCQIDVGPGTLVSKGDGYLYVYYNDMGTNCSGFQMATARAPLSALIAAAQAGAPFTSGAGTVFKKYYNGSFSQPGVTDLANPQNGGGAFSTIFPCSGTCWDPNVAYVSTINQYAMVYDNGWNSINITFSQDGISNWNTTTTVTPAGNPNNTYYYPTLLNTAGGNPLVLGSSFYIYYVNPFGDWSVTRMLRLPVTLTTSKK